MRALLALFSALLCVSPAAAMTLCIEDADYSPFILPDAPAQHAGVLPALAMHAAEHTQQTLKLIRHPWKRCIDMVQKGQVDLILAAIWLPERDVWGQYPKHANAPSGPPDRSKRLWTAEYPVFVANNSSLDYDGKAFNATKVGLAGPPGYVVTKRLAAMGLLYAQPLMPFNGLRLVALERLDGYVVERHIGTHLLYQQNLQSKVRTLSPVFQRDDWYVVFSYPFAEQHPEQVAAFYAALEQARERFGQALLERHLNQAKRQYSATTTPR